ncbi:ABC-2 type transporter-domain-containing protein [Hypoxylon cercidicola]|nr:ABC-2 type transporter-domain-containing protein [Hypoxylon cercidicola]
MALATQDPAYVSWLARRYPRTQLRLGVSFRRLHVHGFTTSVRIQHTVASYALALPRFIASQFSRRVHGKVQILQDFNGLVLDGQMLLVLGCPGSGCTTFLKALSGDTHGIFIGQETEINYSGIPYKRMHHSFKGESIYLAEVDVHFPELTLGQTLGFAASIREKGPNRTSISRDLAQDAAAVFGLTNAFNTWIGSAMIRGVSGGEKRRASIAEALVGGAQLQCWDNSTRGLDSLTAQNFVELLRNSTNQLHTTVAMSMYQTSEAIYEKFDKVTILYEGRQIYFGSVRFAAQYFYDLGFERPPRATTPDFLTSVTNPSERLIRRGCEDRAPRSPDEFAEAWKQSVQAKQLLVDIDDFNASHPLLPEGKIGEDKRQEWNEKLSQRASTYTISTYLQIVSCLQRGFQRLRNQPAPAIGAVFAHAILALVVGSVYYNLPDTSDGMDKRAVLIFFSLLVTAFSPAFEVLAIWAQRPIVEKHNRYAFNHPFTDAAASMICDLPNKIATAILFQVTIYFMTNLRRSSGAFFTWLLFNFVLVLSMSMWFRFIGSISRTVEQSTAPTCILTLLSCIYAGFVVPVPYMVGWLQWFRRVNPISYAYESLMINEFQNRQFPCLQPVPFGLSYARTDLAYKICPVVGAAPGKTYIEGSRYLSEKYTYIPSHLWRNLGILVAMIVIICILHLLAAEFIPAERSKGDILRFRQTRSIRKTSHDSEAHDQVRFARDVGEQDSDNRQEKDLPRSSPQTIYQHSSVFHWRNLCYDVKTNDGKKKRILDGVNGWVKPGTLTALMGVTGAGKTTLLDVLANRASFGTLSGEVCIDGQARTAGFSGTIGYAQQEDIHLPTATVREALEFSALLRQSQAPPEERLKYVDNVIQVLDMGSYADAVVGVPSDSLNSEQRRRLTIAVELVSKPELLLFLDEPTSGLDSQTAWSICTLLRKLANGGQAVLCTIHQPSAQLFRMFDRLLLLNKNGQVIYFGDLGQDASTLVSYFEGNGADKCEPDANPADWMLSVSNTKTDGVDWAQRWSDGPQEKEVLCHLNELMVTSKVSLSQQDDKEYASSWIQQMKIVSKRIFQEYWRSPTYLYSKLALCAGVALFNGLSFQNSPIDIQGLQNLIFSMFLLTQMFGTLDQQIIPRLINGRNLFEARERRSKSYSWTVFLTANILVEFFWQTIGAVLLFIPWYYPTGLWRHSNAALGTSARGALSFVIIWLYCVWISTFSQAVAAGIEHAESAIQLATLMFWFSLVFCGVLVPPGDLPGFWKFVWRASPLTYLIDGLSIAGLEGVEVTCSPVQLLVINPPNDTTCGDYMTPYIQEAGGYVMNPESFGSCNYCPISSADSFLYGRLQAGQENPWNNVGYFTVFVVFNVFATFLFYWLFRLPHRR